MTSPTISDKRLHEDLEELATFGGKANGGVDRVAGSIADVESRTWLRARIEECGLASWSDGIGNVFGSRKTDGGWLLVGSHTDTVPNGGRLDGAYGVMAALEVLRTLHEVDHPAAEILRMVSFWDEEGASPHSPGGLVGSTAFCRSSDIKDIRAFLELHIEQGPRLEQKGLDLAVVEGIVGIDRYSVTVQGAANHAGTTPMSHRADAGWVATSAASHIPQLIADIDVDMVANVGFLELRPGAPNVIPGEAEFIVEFRAESMLSLESAALELAGYTNRLASDCECSVRFEKISSKKSIAFDTDLLQLVREGCGRVAKKYCSLQSYAGHDASILSQYVPSAMLFVPSINGMSHSPEEYTPPNVLAKGCQALLETVVRVWQEGPPGTLG